MDERSDVQVLAAARAGDARAFAVLFDRHRDRVFGHALRLTRLRADAEDVTAAVFLELWRKTGRIRDVEGSLLPWLLVTATNVTRNLQRSLRRYRAALDSLPRAADLQQQSGADLDLQQALATLSRADQRLIALTMEGYTSAEAAIVLGLTPVAARARLSRARNRLRSQLDPTPRLRTRLPAQEET